MPRRLRWLVVPILTAGVVGWMLRPVCQPMSSDELAGFTSPIETRMDRDFYLRVFQQHDGRWLHCKTWLSRQLFF